jgi:uncharacterized protein (TIGR00299 family) protein
MKETYPMHIHFDCFSGISGDMTLAACVDLGVPVDWLQDQLTAVLPADEFSLDESVVVRKGMRACDIDVRVLTDQHARDYARIRDLLTESTLPGPVKQVSLDIFKKIGEAEALVHDQPLETVHFHEVGGVDAIVDIVGTALCMDYLNVTSVSASSIPLGNGFVKCSHGLLPVPAPATINILKGVPVYGTDMQGELVTPTGAGIVSTLASTFGAAPPMAVHKIGYGAGKKVFDSHPNLLRLMLGARRPLSADTDPGDVVILETCIDDMNPELFGYLMERLFEDGALDVYWIPIYMKKNRPGTMIQVLGKKEHQQILLDRILSETTTTGVRYYPVGRQTLDREVLEVDTAYGPVQVKKIVDPAGAERLVPEYEACSRIARETGTPARVVYDTILKDIQR